YNTPKSRERRRALVAYSPSPLSQNDGFGDQRGAIAVFDGKSVAERDADPRWSALDRLDGKGQTDATARRNRPDVADLVGSVVERRTTMVEPEELRVPPQPRHRHGRPGGAPRSTAARATT